MENLVCPKCSTEMKVNEDGDMATDECPKCGGVFLDKRELNTLATGMAGDIEYCSIDREFHEDTFETRLCPVCPNEKMKKIALLRLSDIIFDYCPNCGGFFLDKGEVGKMNQELKALTPNKEAEEYRATHREHIVRIDQTSEVVLEAQLVLQKMVNATYIRVSVFFNREMPPGIRVFQEAWPMRLAKGLGLFWGQDIKIGDAKFDSVFRVQGENETAVAKHLDQAARESLLAFSKGDRSILGVAGYLEITSFCVAYVEGPYIPETVSEVVERSKPFIDELLQIAEKIEAVA